MPSPSFFRFLCVAALLFSQDALGQSVPAEKIHIVSYRNNFIVVSSNPAAAGWAAGEAEKIRARILGEFRWNLRWPEPMVLRVESGAGAAADEIYFADAAVGREKIAHAVLGRIFPTAPFWLRRGLERYFSPQRDFHPDLIRDLKRSGKWLDLGALWKRREPFVDSFWQDIYDREAACFVSFLKKRHALELKNIRKGRPLSKRCEGLEKEWIQWIDQSPALVPQPTGAAVDAKMIERSLARAMSVKVRLASGEVLGADSVLQLDRLGECCRRDIARRKLLASYGELVKLAQWDSQKDSLARGYLECAQRVLGRQEFYQNFEALERCRLARDKKEEDAHENTADQ